MIDKDNLDNLITGLEGLKANLESIHSMMADPNIVMNMSKEQIEFMADAKNSMNFKGLTPQQMQDKINEIIKKHNIK